VLQPPTHLLGGGGNEDKAWKCCIDNWHRAGETMIVEDSGLYLMPIKAYFGASSDGKDACTSVNTFCSGFLEIKYSCIQHIQMYHGRNGTK